MAGILKMPGSRLLSRAKIVKTRETAAPKACKGMSSSNIGSMQISANTQDSWMRTTSGVLWPSWIWLGDPETREAGATLSGGYDKRRKKGKIRNEKKR